MSTSKIKYNSNIVDTDFVNLDTVKLDLNNLEIVRIIIKDDTVYGILFMKNGHSYIVDSTVVNNLDEYCR